MDESDNDLNQLMTIGGDMQNKMANTNSLMSSPDSVYLDAESGTNTANVTLVVEESSPTKLIKEAERAKKMHLEAKDYHGMG